MTHFLIHLNQFYLMINFFHVNFIELFVKELVFFKYYNFHPYLHSNFTYLLLKLIILDYYYLVLSFLLKSFFIII